MQCIRGCVAGVRTKVLGGTQAPRRPVRRHRTLHSLRRAITSDASRRLAAAYDIGEVLGSGTFGEVSLAIDKHSDRKCVLKTVDRKQVLDPAALEQEVSLHSEMDHPHIVRVYETILDDTTLYILLEYCQGGDLFAAIEARGACEEDLARYLSLQIMQAVRYMHDSEVVHRDLKTDNFLLQHEGVPLGENIVKLIDFGFATRFSLGQKKSLTTMCGSPGFMAPEVIDGHAYSESCDIFSCGVIVYNLLTDRMPFEGGNWQDVLHATTVQPLEFATWENEELSESVRALVALMCAKRPDSRPTASQVLKSHWLQEAAAEAATSPIRSSVSAREIYGHMDSWSGLDELTKASLWRVAYHLPESSVAMMREAFKHIDRDGDGKIDLEEFCADTECEEESARLRALFLEVDCNRNGSLDYTEFLAAMLYWRGEIPESAIRAAFRSFDSDNSGSISETEMSEALMNAGVCLSSFSHADANGDGQISFEEFRDLLQTSARRNTVGLCLGGMCERDGIMA